MKIGQTPPRLPNPTPLPPNEPDKQPLDSVEMDGDQPWTSMHRATHEVKQLPNGELHVDQARWGFNEVGLPADWAGIFSDANIDPKHIKNVYLGTKPFDPESLAAHSVLIFEMDDEHPVTNSKGQKDTGLVLSMEARVHQGEHYSMKESLSGKYPVIYQLGTWTDLVEKSTRKEDHKLIRYKLDLNPEQKEQLLRNCLDAAAAKRDEERYNLFTNSCHSVAIEMVNSVLPDSQKMKRWLLPHLYNPMATFPPYGDVIFAGHHLLAHENRLLITPDEGLHPGKHKGQTNLGKVVKHISTPAAWTPLCGLAGGLAAGLGAAATGLPPLVAVPLAAIGGAVLGSSLGETLKRRTHTDYRPSSDYFPKTP